MLLQNRIPPGHKTGFIAGTFDLFHAGHVHALGWAKMRCDFLVVLLQTQIYDRPQKNQPIQTVYERWMQVRGCKFVDEIIPYESEEDLLDLMCTMDFDYRFLDERYSCQEEYTGKYIVKWETHFIPRSHNWSSSELPRE